MSFFQKNFPFKFAGNIFLTSNIIIAKLPKLIVAKFRLYISTCSDNTKYHIGIIFNRKYF